ncbi:MAG: hypothetical protein J7559_07705 [Cohnella sp.]|nr:hypothetical protein [Cohnella sp.]
MSDDREFGERQAPDEQTMKEGLSRHEIRNEPAERESAEPVSAKQEPAASAQKPENQETKRQSLLSYKKHRFWMGIAAALIIAGSFAIGMIDTSSGVTLKDVQANGYGAAKAGHVLVQADADASLTARDYRIEMEQGTTTSRVLIWDFAAEDGDVVTVKASGEVVASNVGIFHKPALVEVPVPSVVEIVGVKDGGGGITYGIKFPSAVGSRAYFNAAPEGSANKYTLGGP